MYPFRNKCTGVQLANGLIGTKNNYNKVCMLFSSWVLKWWVNYTYLHNIGAHPCIIQKIVYSGLVLSTLKGIRWEVLAAISYVQVVIYHLLH